MPASAAARAAVKEALDKHELTRVAAQPDALARETDAFTLMHSYWFQCISFQRTHSFWRWFG